VSSLLSNRSHVILRFLKLLRKKVLPTPLHSVEHIDKGLLSLLLSTHSPDVFLIHANPGQEQFIPGRGIADFLMKGL